MKKTLLLLCIFFTVQAQAQRIMPQSLRWENTIGFYGNALINTVYRTDAPPDRAVITPRLGYSIGVKIEHMLNYSRRIEGSVCYTKRDYHYSIAEIPGTSVGESATIKTNYLSIAAKYKLLYNTANSSIYLSPGATLDIELNHPVINRNSSGLGLMANVGYELRFSKVAFFFVETEARLPSLLQFKSEDFPWKYANIGLNVGVSIMMN